MNSNKNKNAMSNKNSEKSANSSNSVSPKEEGFFSGLFSAAKNVTQKATNAVIGPKSNNPNKNNSGKNKPNSKVVTVAPASAGVNIPTISSNSTAPQTGGAASVNYSVPGNQRQPSEAVMQWATTAGAPTPSAAQMRNVAHGGKRRTIKRKSRSRKSKHSRRSTGGEKHRKSHKKQTKKRHTMKSKTHRRRHNKRRN